MMRTHMSCSRAKMCRSWTVVAAKKKESCCSMSTLLSGSIVPLKGTKELLEKRLPLTKVRLTSLHALACERASDG